MSALSQNSESFRSCIHCGTPFRPTLQRPDFCCAGCQFVHDLIIKNSLGQFYDLQESAATPVKPLVFQKRDYSWLAELAKNAEAAGGPVAALELDLQGISCIGCVWLIEKVFLQKPGALSIQVHSAVGKLEFRWQSGVLDVAAFARELQAFGYLVSPPGKSSVLESRALATRIGLCGAFAMNTMLFTLPGYLGMKQGFEYAPLFKRAHARVRHAELRRGRRLFFQPHMAQPAQPRAAHRPADFTRTRRGVCRLDLRVVRRRDEFCLFRFCFDLRVSDARRALDAADGD